jgi:tellurite resistance protein TehA-like permease
MFRITIHRALSILLVKHADNGSPSVIITLPVCICPNRPLAFIACSPVRDENGRKRTENPFPVSVSAFIFGNGIGSRIVGNGNRSGINGIAKTNRNRNTNENS